mmetsp:Transcript_18530/g.29953  ORF Transcript_18530/g.29953 Transcript_18530/m.29953 type:complete len:201 (+) Transcript_18530:599-1201(+)
MRKASSRAWSGFSRGSAYGPAAWFSELSTTSFTLPPTHSVTSSPVSMSAAPPGWLPIRRCTSKNARSSARRSSKATERRPLIARAFACIGSHTHTTERPSFCAARTSAGSRSRSAAAPIRVMAVTRPGVFRGFSASSTRTKASGVTSGPTLTATGLATPRKYSTTGPPPWRISRSGTQSRWALQAYRRPVVESSRQSAAS